MLVAGIGGRIQWLIAGDGTMSYILYGPNCCMIHVLGLVYFWELLIYSMYYVMGECPELYHVMLDVLQ